MKNLIKSPLNLIIAGVIFASSFAFVQCKKADTEGQITFTYLTTGKAVQGATVKLFIDTTKEDAGFFLCNSNNKITKEKTYTTNSTGIVNECFDLPALINVYAYIQTGTLADTTGMDSASKAQAVAAAAFYVGEGKLNLIANEKTSISIKMSAQ